MNMLLFIKGFIIGISMAAPVGPISILTIRRSLTRGHHAGLATALGVACADGFYAAIAAFGLTTFSGFLINQEIILYGIGGLLLIYLGLEAWKTKPMVIETPLKKEDFLTTLLQTMLVTLTNPMTILIFLAAFAAIGFEGTQHTASDALLICLGVFSGSGLWFISLSSIIAHFRTRVTPFIFMLINKISGALLMGFGTILLAAFLKKISSCLYP
jgi:threonine/homoserine/homoserine lactone efflux protein